jgi:anti-sigma B factor antagonist
VKGKDVSSENFQITQNGDETRILVRGMLDVNTAPSLAEVVDDIIGERRSKVVVDLSALDIIDSSGVAVLVKLYKGVRSTGGHVQIMGARDQPLAIFKLLRMDKVFAL